MNGRERSPDLPPVRLYGADVLPFAAASISRWPRRRNRPAPGRPAIRVSTSVTTGSRRVITARIWPMFGTASCRSCSSGFRVALSSWISGSDWLTS